MKASIKKLRLQTVNFLNQPYPFYFSGKALGLITLVLFVMSFFFNYFFEPFNVYTPEHKMSYFWISFIHSINPVLVLILLALFLNQTKLADNWTVGKDIVFIFTLMLGIGLAQFLIRDLIYDNPNNWSLNYLLEELRNTFLVGLLFVLILVPLNFNRLYAKNIKKASSLNLGRQKLKIPETIKVKTHLKKEDIEFDLQQFLFAKADGNYVELYLKKEPFEKLFKRITIKELEHVLKPYPNVVKTHRSYLVNTYFIKNIKGNAQGYRLEIDHYNNSIPVSRNMIDNFNEKLNRD